ncbi:MAG: hypothetical protein HeimC3_35490 [Candidatus Heimdallarchaeota archaeon LC_3]|nr:MAG: hypothetical protein HeimC3_35490 [Candidatus Heimdallarchaeota archaeon LC_3]
MVVKKDANIKIQKLFFFKNECIPVVKAVLSNKIPIPTPGPSPTAKPIPISLT